MPRLRGWHDDGEMTSPDLPAELKAALDARLEGLVAQRCRRARAAAISQTYREGGGSGAIRTETDALAYALARMPATYAAVTASLERAARDQARTSRRQVLLDVGAGPGTASMGGGGELSRRCRISLLLDANAALRALALDLARGSTRLRNDDITNWGEARAALLRTLKRPTSSSRAI